MDSVTGIWSEKCFIGQFRGCRNIIERTYTILDCIIFYTPTLYSLLLLSCKLVQHVTVQKTVGNCKTVVFVYLNIERYSKNKA